MINTTRRLYRIAHSMARHQGARRTLIDTERLIIQRNLYPVFGVSMTDKVMFTYRAWRDLNAIKWLFALSDFTFRAEDHWRQVKAEYGQWSPVAESARQQYYYWRDLYYTESSKFGGVLSDSEIALVVTLWRQAQDNAGWRQQYGDTWRLTYTRAESAVIATAKRNRRLGYTGYTPGK